MRPRIASSLSVATLAVVALACDGRTTGILVTGPTSDVRVRMLNALTSSQAVDLIVDGQVASSGVPFGGASPYVALTAGSHRLQARSSTTGTILVDQTRDLNTNGSFSFVPAPGLGELGARFIADDPTPTAGMAEVRVVHVAAARGAVSVYVTSPTADLSSATPVISLLPFGLASDYVAVTPGTYRIRVTPAGNPSSILLDMGNVTLASGTVRTLMMTDALGGGLPTNLSIVADTN
jgi:hypothetical protein